MRGYQRATAIDYAFTIRFEGVRCIIELECEQSAQEEICQTIDYKLEPRVIDNPATAQKTAAKDALVSFIQ